MPFVNKNVDRPWIKKAAKPQSRPKPSVGQGRSNPRRELYGSQRWREDSIAHRNANPLCEECMRQHKLVDSEVSDHTVPLNDTAAIQQWIAEHDGADPVWDWRNRTALCKACHQRKSGKEGGERRARKG